MTTFKRILASLLIVSTTMLGMPLVAQARMVSTDEALSTAADVSGRSRVSDFLQRADVRQALEAQGVSADAALERVQSLSDAELAQLAGRMDQAPAGGDVLSLMFTVFIVLLVTDIFGLTKVFPFTRSIR